ncbi:nucleoside phosphorylase domain-containing protein, partial [Dactylonectria macrodidyma]
MVSPPPSRDKFEIAIACALPLEYNAVALLIDHFWDKDSDTYGRAVGDMNTYATGRIGAFDVVLVLLPSMGKVNAASAAASLRSSYPGLRLVLLTGICGGVPGLETGKEMLLGDVVISKSVLQYDLGRRYPDGFSIRDTNEVKLMKSVRNFVSIFETDHARKALEIRAAALLERIQNYTTERQSECIYQYLGGTSDKLFQASYRHKHHAPLECLCAGCHESLDAVCDESRKMSCEELGCDNHYVVWRERLEMKQQLEREGRLKEAQAPSIFVGCVGSGDTVLKSGNDRDRIAKRHGILAFAMEGVGFWDDVPCIIVKGVCDYADSHKNKNWQNFAAATAACVARGLVERYPQTDE